MSDFKKDEQLYKNLLTILKLFKNRPYHLAKYLIENEAFNDDFIKKLIDSQKLNDMGQEQSKALVKAVYFVDISHMTDYFNSLTQENTEVKKKSKKSLTVELNSKLDQCLKEERYEDAIRIRDYMTKHNIKRLSE
jgi:UvrB/uvrC motif